MKLTDLFNKNELSLSFEVFPPKTDTAFESVKHATEEIAKLRPSFMSVTYGAGGVFTRPITSSDFTVKISCKV